MITQEVLDSIEELTIKENIYTLRQRIDSIKWAAKRCGVRHNMTIRDGKTVVIEFDIPKGMDI